MKHSILSDIFIRLAVLLTAAAAGPALRAQSVEPFSPYGVFSPSVESYQMTRCGNLLPSLYTGAMTFSLPLMTYSDPDFTIPVTLEYSFDGYKPGQHSGSVGYGWYLDCGGVITREVRGIPDEGDLDGGLGYNCTVHGWRAAGSYRDSLETHSGSIYSIRRMPADHTSTDNYVGILQGYDPFSDTPMYSSPYGGSHRLYDTAPDIYHFRFLGHSGDFMMMPDGTVRVYNSDIPHGELSVAFTDNGSMPWYVVITLTDGKGFEYRFEPEGISETPDPGGNHPNRPSKSVSSYRLAGILAPNGRRVAFTYDRYFTALLSFRYDTLLEGGYLTYGNWSEDEHEGSISPSFEIRRTFTREAAACLRKVSVFDSQEASTADSILFVYAPAPGDEGARSCFEQGTMPGDYLPQGTAPVLTSVTMHGRNGLADSTSLTYQSAPSGTPKTFLRSVTGMKAGKHTFDYDFTAFPLPPNDTQGTDHWGYWNGASVSDLREHLTETSWMYEPAPDPPGTFVRPCAAHLYDQMTDGVKEADAARSVCGALIRIHYPHGGRTVVEYEPNEVTRRMNAHTFDVGRSLEPVDSLNPSASWTVGGVRVRSLIDSTGFGPADTTRFSYTDRNAGGRGSGILMTMPRYAVSAQYTHQVYDLFESHGVTGVASVSAVGFGNCCGFVLDRDPHVVYPAVTVIHPDGSETEHRFTSVADTGLEDAYQVEAGLTKHILGPCDWIGPDGRTPTCLVPAGRDCRNLRGQPKSTVVRDASGRELKRTEYSYSYDQVVIPHLCFNNVLTYNIAGYIVRSPLPVSTAETDYGVTVRTDRTFNALGQRKSERTIAAGDTLEVRYRYIHETAAPSPSGYDRLLCDAAKTRRADGKAYLFAAEHYDYGDLDNPFPTRIISRIIPEGIDVSGLSEAALFTAAQALQGKAMDFEYNDPSHLHRLTLANFPGRAYISYAWKFNHIETKTENGTPNTTHFYWKDQVGLTGIKSPSFQEESYKYDSHNRPWKTLDTQGRAESVIHYNLKNE